MGWGEVRGVTVSRQTGSVVGVVVMSDVVGAVVGVGGIGPAAVDAGEC